jgi:hypothetical protein
MWDKYELATIADATFFKTNTLIVPKPVSFAKSVDPNRVGSDGGTIPAHEALAAELSNHLIEGVVLTPGIVATILELQQVGFHYAA